MFHKRGERIAYRTRATLSKPKLACPHSAVAVWRTVHRHRDRHVRQIYDPPGSHASEPSLLQGTVAAWNARIRAYGSGGCAGEYT